jgi:hypothetical protein
VIVTIAILTGILCAGVAVENYRRNVAIMRGEARYQYYSVALGPDGAPWLSLRPGSIVVGGSN